jgi:hypothetical protein
VTRWRDSRWRQRKLKMKWKVRKKLAVPKPSPPATHPLVPVKSVKISPPSPPAASPAPGLDFIVRTVPEIGTTAKSVRGRAAKALAPEDERVAAFARLRAQLVRAFMANDTNTVGRICAELRSMLAQPVDTIGTDVRDGTHDNEGRRTGNGNASPEGASGDSA